MQEFYITIKKCSYFIICKSEFNHSIFFFGKVVELMCVEIRLDFIHTTLNPLTNIANIIQKVKQDWKRHGIVNFLWLSWLSKNWFGWAKLPTKKIGYVSFSEIYLYQIDEIVGELLARVQRCFVIFFNKSLTLPYIQRSFWKPYQKNTVSRSGKSSFYGTEITLNWFGRINIKNRFFRFK